MARKKRKKGFGNWEFSRPTFDIPAETKQSIAAVVLILLGILSFLSLFDAAGTVGVYINGFFSILFGILRWLGFILFMVVGYLLLKRETYELRFSNYFGLLLFVFGFTGLVHISLHSDALLTAAQQGLGGGYIGFALSGLLYTYLGIWAGVLLLFALSLIGVLLLFNTSFADLSEFLFRIKSWFAQRRDAKVSKRVKRLQEQKDAEYRREHGLDEQDEQHDEEESEEDEESSDEQDEQHDEEESEEDEESSDEELEFNAHKLGATAAKSIPSFSHVHIDLPVSLLTGRTGKPDGGDLEANKLLIQKTLENFNIPVQMGDAQVGPTVTQYTLKPSEGIKLSRITSLTDNLALALAMHPIRIEAPIPGRSLVGVEVPNTAKATVPLKDIIASKTFSTRSSNMLISLGKDVMGKPVLADLTKMPHLLVAGSTGSGKSVFVNSLIISLLYQNGPQNLRFIMVDPKRVELPIYNKIPHLLTPVITEVKKTINALRWTINEMERRFEVLSKVHKRNIEAYNASAKEPLPYIVFIIDELADLMATSSAEVEAAIIRIAQMARAVGIHLVLATQRPSVDVITGLIKANVPARVAFSVASLVDSRTILDTAGAEKLLGRGDMLYMSADISKPLRIQGAFASDDEIKAIADYLKKQADPEYLEGITEKQAGGSGASGGGDGDDDDPLLEEAKEVIRQAKKASASLLQRRLRVGYARAARILDILEQQGYIGPSEGAKPREILMEAFERDTMKEQSDYADEISDEEEQDDDSEEVSDFDEDEEEVKEEQDDDSEEDEEEYNTEDDTRTTRF